MNQGATNEITDLAGPLEEVSYIEASIIILFAYIYI